ncbi:MAG: TetR family transcriptional regulator [Chitinophagales bacterium]
MEEIKNTDKREYILDVAERLFAEHGFEAVSVREISKAADINIAMVSYYFGSKEKLYEAVIQRKLIVSDTILSQLKKYTTNKEKLFALVDLFIVRLFENRHLQNIIFREISMNQRSNMTEIIITQVHNNFHLIIDIIQNGIKNKEFKKVDVELTALTIISIIKTYTHSSKMACKVLHLEENENVFETKYKNRLRKHIIELLSNHLGIESK